MRLELFVKKVPPSSSQGYLYGLCVLWNKQDVSKLISDRRISVQESICTHNE